MISMVDQKGNLNLKFSKMDSLINVASLIGLWIPQNAINYRSFIYYPFKMIEITDTTSLRMYKSICESDTLKFYISKNDIVIEKCCVFFNVHVEGDTIITAIGDTESDTIYLGLKKISDTIFDTNLLSSIEESNILYEVKEVSINPFLTDYIVINSKSNASKFEYRIHNINKSFFLVQYAKNLEIKYYPIEKVTEDSLYIKLIDFDKQIILTKR